MCPLDSPQTCSTWWSWVALLISDQISDFNFFVPHMSSRTQTQTIWIPIAQFMKEPFLCFSSASFFRSISRVRLVELSIWRFRPLPRCLCSGFEWRTKYCFCSSETAEMWTERQGRMWGTPFFQPGPRKWIGTVHDNGSFMERDTILHLQGLGRVNQSEGCLHCQVRTQITAF
jgi:hypothetical protein